MDTRPHANAHETPRGEVDFIGGLLQSRSVIFNPTRELIVAIHYATITDPEGNVVAKCNVTVDVFHRGALYEWTVTLVPPDEHGIGFQRSLFIQLDDGRRGELFATKIGPRIEMRGTGPLEK